MFHKVKEVYPLPDMRLKWVVTEAAMRREYGEPVSE